MVVWGALSIFADNMHYQLGPGDWMTIPAGVYHRMEGSAEYFEASTPGCLEDSIRHEHQEEEWVSTTNES